LPVEPPWPPRLFPRGSQRRFRDFGNVSIGTSRSPTGVCPAPRIEALTLENLAQGTHAVVAYHQPWHRSRFLAAREIRGADSLSASRTRVSTCWLATVSILGPQPEDQELRESPLEALGGTRHQSAGRFVAANHDAWLLLFRRIDTSRSSTGTRRSIASSLCGMPNGGCERRQYEN
jgi:hypothetical protein